METVPLVVTLSDYPPDTCVVNLFCCTCRFGLLYFVSVNTLFSNVAALELFINERVFFM